ncbi:hypothetical protein GT002_09210, partial [Streptomyces sp. SID4917]
MTPRGPEDTSPSRTGKDHTETDHAGTVARASAPAASEASPPSFHEMWRDLAPLGRDPGSGGYRRYAW